MLVLSRSIGGKIRIADNIVITIVEIRGSKVRVGITAPTDVPVHREEIYESIKADEAANALAEPEATKEPPAPAVPIVADAVANVKTPPALAKFVKRVAEE